MQSKFEVLRTKAADGVNPTLRAGEDKICEAGKKGAKFLLPLPFVLFSFSTDLDNVQQLEEDNLLYLVH